MKVNRRDFLQSAAIVAYLKDERTENVFAGTEVCVEAV